MPTPIPVADKQTVLEFAAGHRAISSDWDAFHASFDVWRESLAACDASAVEVALARFAGDFVTLTEAARGLPRDRILRGIADLSVLATEREEEALRQLRDNWHPGEPAFFEGVDVARASASSVRKEVEDGLGDLERRTSSASESLVSKFSTAFSLIDLSWDEFDRSYDLFRSDERELTSAEIVSGLNQLVDEFRGIVVAVRKLPASEVTRALVSTLAQAADDEELALRKLRGSFEKLEEPAEEAAPEPQAESAPEGAVEEPQAGSEAQESDKDETKFVQRDRSLFDAFDAQMIVTNSLRREVPQALTDALEDASAANRAAVADFTSQYAALTRSWDAFHQGYDLWRVNEGGCGPSGGCGHPGRVRPPVWGAGKPCALVAWGGLFTAHGRALRGGRRGRGRGAQAPAQRVAPLRRGGLSCPGPGAHRGPAAETAGGHWSA